MVNAFKLTRYEYVVKAEFIKPAGRFEIHRFISFGDAIKCLKELQIRSDVLSFEFRSALVQEREESLFN